MELTTQQKGITTEIYVAAYLLELGYNVSQPLCQDSKYDLIVDVNNKLLRLQVKTARQNNPKSITFNCRSTTKNSVTHKSRTYTSDEIDYFATYWNHKVYLVPVGQCSSEKTLHLEQTNRKDWTYIEDCSAKEVLSKV
jgi:hypothetical protein